MTDRQKHLLAAIINQFIETAEAVGSVSLNDNYKFNVSPATIRNEMAELVRQGYLDKLHSSAGRTPTTMGLKYFLQELIEELDEIDQVTKALTQQHIHNARFNKSTLIREGLRFLSNVSGNPAIGLIDGEVYYAGLSTIMDAYDFNHVSKLKQIMMILEDYAMLSNLFHKGIPSDGVKVLIGEEDTGFASFSDYAVVFTNLLLHKGQMGYIAVIGPNRMNYKKVIPAVEFTAESINSSVAGWN